MPIDLKSTDDESVEELLKSNHRLRVLLATAENELGKRYALMDLSDGTLVICTSSEEPTDYERTLFACFARHWCESASGYHMGRLRAVYEIGGRLFGKDQKTWPKSLRDALADESKKAGNAASVAVELQRVAMSPFGLREELGGDDLTLWTKEREERRDG